MRKQLFLATILSAAILSAVSCQKDEFLKPEEANADAPLQAGAVERSQWKKVGIPSSTANVRRLYKERFGADGAGAQAGGPARMPASEIEATHYYVRFEPADDEQYYALKANENLDLYPFPLDCEMPEDAVSYIDPEQPLDAPPFLFGTMPVDYTPAPGIAYTIIDDIVMKPAVAALLSLYNPVTGGIAPVTPDPDTPGGVDGPFVFGPGIVGPGEAFVFPDGVVIGPDLSHPSGRIRVWDDEMGAYIPLVGAKVKVSNLCEGSATAITDTLGNFRVTKSFNSDVEWYIVWEGDKFDIRDGDLVQAYYNRGGDNTREKWNLDIGSADDGSKSMRFATIHRAAHRYFKGDIGGLQRASAHGNVLGQQDGKVKISYYDYGGGAEYYYGEVLAGQFLSHVRIYRHWVGLPANSTDYIFSATCHELGHIIHYNNMGNIQFWQAETYIKESWAKFVEWHLTMLEYRSLGLAQASLNTLNDDLSRQWWPYKRYSSNMSSQPEYTSIFIDLVDDFDQSIDNDANNTYPTDSVTGYTAFKLNTIIMDSYGWMSLTSNLKSNKPTGVTDAQIDQLLERYVEICK